MRGRRGVERSSFSSFLKVQGDRIASAKYQTYGCGPTIAACHELTTEMAARTMSKNQSCPILTLAGINFTVSGEPEVVLVQHLNNPGVEI